MNTIATFIVAIYLSALSWYSLWSWPAIRKIKKRQARADSDINTLHQNETVLLSTLKELNHKLRTYERQAKKNSKTIFRKIGRPDEREAKGTDAV